MFYNEQTGGGTLIKKNNSALIRCTTNTNTVEEDGTRGSYVSTYFAIAHKWANQEAKEAIREVGTS